MNHLGDTNKMVSDTPRTDAEYERLFEIYQNAERINGSLCCAFENDMRLCGQLERELNAANERIKLLEEALDKTSKAACKLIKRLEREVYALRLYGNKDCTIQADEMLKEEDRL